MEFVEGVDNGTRGLGLGFAGCVWPTEDRLCPLEERECVEGLEELKQMEEWVEEEGSKEDKRNVLYPQVLGGYAETWTGAEGRFFSWNLS